MCFKNLEGSSKGKVQKMTIFANSELELLQYATRFSETKTSSNLSEWIVEWWFYIEKMQAHLVEWVQSLIGSEHEVEMVDSKLEEKPTSKQLKRMLLIVLRCVDPDIQHRPSMGQILVMLQPQDLTFYSLMYVFPCPLLHTYLHACIKFFFFKKKTPFIVGLSDRNEWVLVKMCWLALHLEKNYTFN